jgi:hypothetical chaperone protein
LQSLIDNKYGFMLFDTIEHTKQELSKQSKQRFLFEADEIVIDQIITQQRFSRSIRDYCALVDEALQMILDKANIEASDIDVVIRTGGSSQVPAVVDVLVNRFGAATVESYDPFLSVSSGLAIAAADECRS